MMGDEDQARAFGGETAERIAQFALRSEVEGVGRLVQQKLARAMHQGAGNQDAALSRRRTFLRRADAARCEASMRSRASAARSRISAVT